MNTFEVMEKIAHTFIKGAACEVTTAKTLTEKEMNKGRGANRNPYLDGSVKAIKVFSGVVLGTDYAASLANAATRIGNEIEREEVKVKSNWHKPCAVLGEWFSTDKTTETKVYLKLQRNAKQVAYKVKTTYYLNGHEASAAEVASIEKWLKNKSHTQSSTQTDLGLTATTEQMFILPQLDTVVSIKQGERCLSPMRALSEVEEVETLVYAYV